LSRQKSQEPANFVKGADHGIVYRRWAKCRESRTFQHAMSCREVCIRLRMSLSNDRFTGKTSVCVHHESVGWLMMTNGQKILLLGSRSWFEQFDSICFLGLRRLPASEQLWIVTSAQWEKDLPWSCRYRRNRLDFL
jgi:hypothetical protein